MGEQLEEDWKLLKEKLEATAKEVRKGQIGAKEESNADFLLGTLLALEGALHLMKQIEDRHNTEEKTDD